MTKYHISISGKPAICRAKGNCPRGSSYSTLTETRTVIVSNEYDEIAQTEPQITKDLTSLAEKEKVEMVGLEYRLKSKDGTVEKVVKRKKAKSAKDLYDVVRYTVKIDVDNYYNKKEKIMDEMKSKGYKVVKEKDTWRFPGYKGINIKMENSNGDKFELQFHTEDSLKAKEEAHKLYEKQRLPETTEEEKENLGRAMDKIFNKVPIPKKNE